MKRCDILQYCFSLDSNEIYLCICESISDLGLENDIKKLIDKKRSENIKIKNYLKDHPKGVPFICGMDNKFKDEALEILQCEFDISIDGEMKSLQIIEAWSEEEARRMHERIGVTRGIAKKHAKKVR